LSATPARSAALSVLRAVRRGDLADRALERAAVGFDTQDRAWLQELVYGTLRLRARLDHLLQRRVHRRLESLQADVLDILRLGAYQLVEMGGVPDYAAVSQSVDLARTEAGQGAAGLVNGVLRRLGREGWGGTPFEQDPAQYLATWGSHPRWLVDRWIARWGAEAALRLVERDNTRPGVFLRPVGMGTGQALRLLLEAGIAAQPVDRFPSALSLPPRTSPGAALAVVPAVVQDPAAGRVVDYAGLPEQGVVADLCAAPGGKAMVLASASTADGRVIAADRSLRKVARVRENWQRLPALQIYGMVADARLPAIRPVDGVLLDVPCTGTGTLARHPDARWRVGPDELGALVKLQREILHGAARAVRPGGVLVYATCSLEPEENEIQVETFLEDHPEFTIEPGPVPASLLDGRGRLFLTPHVHGFDGAFAARLRRR
jgi:16S rRNA (cytosine967-C5)-methyltransferase